MTEEPLVPAEAAALAREHGGVICFASDSGAEKVEMGVLSLWRLDAELVVLRVQTDTHDLVIRLREKDLRWVVNEPAQQMRDDLGGMG